MINSTPIAIIPARIGSKRVKFKNIVNFKRKPLIIWTIEAAIKSKIFHKIYVSTDSKIIKNKIIKYNKKINFLSRPKKYSGSKTKSETLIRHLILKNNLHKKYDTIFLLQATSPYRSYRHVKSMWDIYRKENLKSFVSVSKKKNKSKIKIKNKLFFDKKKKKNNFIFYQNGAIYISNIKSFLKNSNFVHKKTSYFYMEEKYSLDVDNYLDLE